MKFVWFSKTRSLEYIRKEVLSLLALSHAGNTGVAPKFKRSDCSARYSGIADYVSVAELVKSSESVFGLRGCMEPALSSVARQNVGSLDDVRYVFTKKSSICSFFEPAHSYCDIAVITRVCVS
jgi:hypothetical protein